MEPHLPVRVRTYYRLGSIVLQYILNWRKVFTIVGGIEIRKDGIKVHFKLRISQFIGTMGIEVRNQVDADKVIEQGQYD